MTDTLHPEASGASAEHARAAHGGLRSISATLVNAGGGLIIAGAALWEPLRRVLGVGPVPALVLGLGHAALAIAAAVAIRRAGPTSLSYRTLNRAENVWAIAGSGVLTYLSGSAASIFQMFYLGTVAMSATTTANRRFNPPLFGAQPPLLALAFFVRGDHESAVTALAFGVVAFLIHMVLAPMTARVVALRAERDALAGEVAAMHVREERARIAADLHDGVATELLGVLQLARAVEEPAAAELSERAHAAIRELREVVVWLRDADAPDLGFAADLARLRQGLIDACGADSALSFDADDGLEVAVPLRRDIVRFVQEAAKNALVHGHPRNIHVKLNCDGAAIHAVVSDDGSGLATSALPRGRGVDSMRARTERWGGAMTLADASPGTVVHGVFPLIAAPSAGNSR